MLYCSVFKTLFPMLPVFFFSFFNFYLARTTLASLMRQKYFCIFAISIHRLKKKKERKRHLWLSRQSSEPFLKPVCNKRKAKAICKKINKGKVFSIRASSNFVSYYITSNDIGKGCSIWFGNVDTKLWKSWFYLPLIVPYHNVKDYGKCKSN